MSGSTRRAIVVAGGDGARVDVERLPADAFVVCADSGLHLARDLGLEVAVVVGDLDSAEPAAIAAAERAGTEIDRHPSAKDETDLELALRRARDEGCLDVTVVGFAGGRLDHFVANLMVLTAPDLAGVSIRAITDGATVHVVRDRVVLDRRAGRIVTLLAVGGPATGIETTGLEYPLRGETLTAGSGRGVSNVMTGEEAHVALDDGVLLVIQTEES